MNDPFKAKGIPPIELDGFTVSVFRDETDDMVTIQILSEGAEDGDLFPGHDVPRVRVVLNSEGWVTTRSGAWVNDLTPAERSTNSDELIARQRQTLDHARYGHCAKWNSPCAACKHDRTEPDEDQTERDSAEDSLRGRTL